MADQGKWFKLWESALDDQQLENLELDNWARWARLGTYLKKHGTNGQIMIQAPGRALQTLLRVGDFDAVIRVVKVLPGYVVEEVTDLASHVTVASVPFKITFQNWSKYQGDFSTERTRRWRSRRTANVTRQEERRSRRDVDVEEKRRDVSPNPPLPLANSTSTPHGRPVSTLRLNGKPYEPEPELPEIPIPELHATKVNALGRCRPGCEVCDEARRKEAETIEKANAQVEKQTPQGGDK